ncbi:helix-turn-helix transcriptional regulator [Amycolatopsis minnesotensis]|uniref:Helix-turn-helix transcriptional regulator n=1 Tax=Amycolatopsis minnesotensis TaxID=337894 RepID=A0ABP5BX72_9PSEU
MVRKRNSSAHKREIGEALRNARERANLTAAELAGRLDCSASKVSRMESGHRGVAELDLTMFLANCGTPRKEVVELLEVLRESDDGYRLRPHQERLPDELRSLIAQENLATSIISFEPQVVPGLLQIKDYARALFGWTGRFDDAGIEMRVRARMARQKRLRQPDAPAFTFYLPEQTLRAQVVPAALMHDQVMHLLLISSFDHCTIRVVPEAACPSGVLGHTFQLMRFAEHRPVVYVENQTASLFLEKSEDLDVYRQRLSRVAEFALDGGESREWLARLASEYNYAKDASSGQPRTGLA